MPFKKRFHRKRKSFVGKSTRSVAVKALKIAQSAKSAIEHKFLDTVVDEPNVSSSGTSLISLNNPEQGMGDSDRIGDTLKNTSLRFRYLLTSDNSSAAAVRIIIIYDKYDTISSINDVLTLNAVTEALIADYVKDKRGDYIIMHDKMYNISNDLRNKAVGNVFMRVNKKTQFSAGTTDIEKGSIKAFLISDVSAGAATQPAALLYFRAFYMDA